jgi:hypothetical protein
MSERWTEWSFPADVYADGWLIRPAFWLFRESEEEGVRLK